MIHRNFPDVVLDSWEFFGCYTAVLVVKTYYMVDVWSLVKSNLTRIRWNNGWVLATSSHESKECFNSLKTETAVTLPKVTLESKIVVLLFYVITFYFLYFFLCYYFLNRCYQKSFDIFLKTFVRVSVIGLVLKRQVYRSNFGCSNSPRAVYCNLCTNKIN